MDKEGQGVVDKYLTMTIHNKIELKQLRQNLRKGLTPAEVRLWKYLKDSQLEGRKFRRQHSIGQFIIDFYCPEEKLAIELNGNIHFNPINENHDLDKKKYLNSLNIKVIEFKNREIFEKLEIVLGIIKSNFREFTTPTPPKIGEDTEKLENYYNIPQVTR